MKRVYQVSFTVEQEKIEDIFVALGNALASHSALKSGFSIDYVDTVEDDDPRYSDRSVVPISRTVEIVDDNFDEEERTQTYSRVVGDKNIKDYIVDFLYTVGSCTSDEAGAYLVNESARYQEEPYKASSASPSLSGLAKIGLAIKPKFKSGRWKAVSGITLEQAHKLLKNAPPLNNKRKERVNV